MSQGLWSVESLLYREVGEVAAAVVLVRGRSLSWSCRDGDAKGSGVGSLRPAANIHIHVPQTTGQGPALAKWTLRGASTS